ncbi:hypothetical protein SR41_03260 [Sphingomonas melonis]|uniref:Uncharacterized protein n=1 Tax=Sphingomonas melonis TaxID=152682 RepID=A0A0D1MAX5_9SPHN|nr:hypothetical protein [Sphingomonas melonis]KIU29560.1 hypothetical protein SR41_03260 [Sphingomonas melonis]
MTEPKRFRLASILGAELGSTSLRAHDAGKRGAMKKGSAGTSVRDCSHPFRRVMRPASMRSTFGRVLATHHVLPSLTLGRPAQPS